MYGYLHRSFDRLAMGALHWQPSLANAQRSGAGWVQREIDCTAGWIKRR